MTRARALPFKCSAVITDVDGALVDDEKKLTSRGTPAVAELRASGIVFSIISSRLSEIAKLLTIPLAEIAVIGDGGNDVAMFERSGLSIAMGNASPEVQQAADFATDSNREEGFASAVERFILGGGRSSKRAEAPRAGGRA